MTLVFDTNKQTVKAVKDLGWLSRNQGNALEMFASETAHNQGGCWFAVVIDGEQERVYFTHWDDITVMFDWVNRKRWLKDLPIHWDRAQTKEEFLTKVVGEWVKDCPILFNN